MKELNLLRPKLMKKSANIKRVKDRILIATRPNEAWEIDIKYLYIHGEARFVFIWVVIFHIILNK